jgi:hypothetical protein
MLPVQNYIKITLNGAKIMGVIRRMQRTLGEQLANPLEGPKKDGLQ